MFSLSVAGVVVERTAAAARAQVVILK